MMWLRFKMWWEQQAREYKAQICAVKVLIGGIFGLTKYFFGVGYVDPYVAYRRRWTCMACPHQVRWYLGIRRCGDCKCFIVPKTTLEKEKCPKGKW